MGSIFVFADIFKTWLSGICVLATVMASNTQLCLMKSEHAKYGVINEAAALKIIPHKNNIFALVNLSMWCFDAQQN